MSTPRRTSLGIAFFRLRLLPSGERLAVAGADDERPVLRVVELRRVGRLVAAHADRGRDLALDVAGRVRDVRAARAVTGLALHVPAADAAPLDALFAELGPIDAAHAARLLPAGDVAADAVEAVLLLHRHQRVVGVRVAGLGPEVGRVLVALDAGVRADVRRLAARWRGAF